MYVYIIPQKYAALEGFPDLLSYAPWLMPSVNLLAEEAQIDILPLVPIIGEVRAIPIKDSCRRIQINKIQYKPILPDCSRDRLKGVGPRSGVVRSPIARAGEALSDRQIHLLPLDW